MTQEPRPLLCTFEISTKSMKIFFDADSVVVQLRDLFTGY